MRTLFLQAALLLFLVFLQVLPAAAVSIGFTPGSSFTAVSGNNYSVEVVVSGLVPGGTVSAYNLDVLYNPTLLTAGTVVYGAGLGNSALVEVLEGTHLASGRINFAAVSLLSDLELQALQGGGGSVTLATLNFVAIGSGNVNLAFDWFYGRDVKGNNNEVILGNGPAPVPEPGTVLLIGAGCISLWGFRRKMKRTSGQSG